MPFAARHAFSCKDMMTGHISCRQHLFCIFYVGIPTYFSAIVCFDVSSKLLVVDTSLKYSILHIFGLTVVTHCMVVSDKRGITVSGYLFDFVWLCLSSTCKNQRFPRMRLWLHPTHAKWNRFREAPRGALISSCDKTANST